MFLFHRPFEYLCWKFVKIEKWTKFQQIKTNNNIRYILIATNERDRSCKTINRYQIWKLETILNTLDTLTVKFGLLSVKISAKRGRQFSDFLQIRTNINIRYILITTNERDKSYKTINRYQIWNLETILKTLDTLTVKFGLLSVKISTYIFKNFETSNW